MNDYESKHVEYDLYLLCKKYHQQRDDLLAALKDIMALESRNRIMPIGKEWDAAREAVAKAEGL